MEVPSSRHHAAGEHQEQGVQVESRQCSCTLRLHRARPPCSPCPRNLPGCRLQGQAGSGTFPQGMPRLAMHCSSSSCAPSSWQCWIHPARAGQQGQGLGNSQPGPCAQGPAALNVPLALAHPWPPGGAGLESCPAEPSLPLPRAVWVFLLPYLQ